MDWEPIPAEGSQKTKGLSDLRRRAIEQQKKLYFAGIAFGLSASVTMV